MKLLFILLFICIITAMNIPTLNTAAAVKGGSNIEVKVPLAERKAQLARNQERQNANLLRHQELAEQTLKKSKEISLMKKLKDKSALNKMTEDQLIGILNDAKNFRNPEIEKLAKTNIGEIVKIREAAKKGNTIINDQNPRDAFNDRAEMKQLADEKIYKLLGESESLYLSNQKKIIKSSSLTSKDKKLAFEVMEKISDRRALSLMSPDELNQLLNDARSIKGVLHTIDNSGIERIAISKIKEIVKARETLTNLANQIKNIPQFINSLDPIAKGNLFLQSIISPKPDMALISAMVKSDAFMKDIPIDYLNVATGFKQFKTLMKPFPERYAEINGKVKTGVMDRFKSMLNIKNKE